MRFTREGVRVTLAATGDDGGAIGVIKECRRASVRPLDTPLVGLACEVLDGRCVVVEVSLPVSVVVALGDDWPVTGSGW